MKRLYSRAFAPFAVAASVRQFWPSPRLRSKRSEDLVELPLESSGNEERPLAPPGAAREEGRHASEDSSFDELEAASQELHDLCAAIVSYLRRADPDAMTFPRLRRTGRDTVPKHRRFITGHRPKEYKCNSFQSRKELEEGTALYLQWGEKLLTLLSQSVVERMLDNIKDCNAAADLRVVAQRAKPTARAMSAHFSKLARWHKHAPFEIEALRNDVPVACVKHARAMRDRSTLLHIQMLMEPHHPYRAALEERMWTITSRFASWEMQQP